MSCATKLMGRAESVVEFLLMILVMIWGNAAESKFSHSLS